MQHIINGLLSWSDLIFQNALALTRNVNPVELHDCATRMREYVEGQLLSNAHSPHSQRTTCDMVGCPSRKKDSSWVNCDVCGRWVHLICVSLEVAPDAHEDYVCPICKAQYE